MPIYRVTWPEDESGTRWGHHTDWVIRADNQMEALELAVKDQHRWMNNSVVTLADLSISEVSTSGPPEIILWYGPDA